MSPRSRKLLLFIPLSLFLGLGVAVFATGDLLSLDELKRRQQELQGVIAARPVAFTLGFLVIFALVAAVAPGAAVLKVAAGALFGLWAGTALALAGTLLAALLGFLSSRYLMRHWVERRFHRQAEAINRGVDREGAVYLLAMRFNPLIPFFLINFGMGLTRMRAVTFAAVSLIGLIPASFVYANAGTELARIERASDILSLRLILSLVLLNLMPLAGRWFSNWLRGRRAVADPLLDDA